MGEIGSSFQEEWFCVAFFEGTAFLLVDCMRALVSLSLRVVRSRLF
jgi:hypothetical protein